MDLGLKGKVALITGSSRGLGKAIALALAQEGADVIIHGRWNKTVGNTAYEIEHRFNHDIRAYQCVCDATDSKGIKEFFEQKMPQIGRLNILVNNVGNAEKFGSFFELTDEDWMRCYDQVFLSAVRFTREALPFLKASLNGRIINISSLSSHQPGNFNHHYAAAKAAMNILTKQLAATLGNMNILVNAICPSTLSGGVWEQNVADRAKRQDMSLEEAEYIMKFEEFKKSPLCRMGTLENVANMVAYLASDKGDFQTGHIYDIDGGITRGL